MGKILSMRNERAARPFNKAFLPCTVASAVLIAAGLAGLLSKGINFGLDYRPGLIEEVAIAPAVMDVTYSGSSNVTLEMTANAAQVVVSGIGAENKTISFTFAENQSVKTLAASLESVAGVKAKVNSLPQAQTAALFASSVASNRLVPNEPYKLYCAGQIKSSVDDVRAALSGLEAVSVQQLGGTEDARYQIRMADKGDGKTSADMQEAVLKKMQGKFGKDNVAVIKSDFIGSTFSHSIAWQSVLLMGGAVFLIWLYSAVRFHWDFAVGAVIALIHDALIMMTFIVWSGMEFTTMTVAAILTIVGYSINDTIVILDRERSLLPLMKTDNFGDIVNQALTDTLSRSIITTVTTMFAAAALYIFTSGDIKNFALALIVGLVSGCYSSLFISSGFIVATRKNWKREFGIHHSLKGRTGVLEMGVTV